MRVNPAPDAPFSQSKPDAVMYAISDSDCEGGFSCQNSSLEKLSEAVKEIQLNVLTIKIEGNSLEDFEYQRATVLDNREPQIRNYSNLQALT